MCDAVNTKVRSRGWICVKCRDGHLRLSSWISAKPATYPTLPRS